MEHYYSGEPVSESREQEIQYTLQGKTLHFITDNSVFSKDRVDHGSDILNRAVLENETAVTGACIDIGCGYGPMGISLATFFPETRWAFLDVNERAMGLCRRNAQKNGIIERSQVGDEATLTKKKLLEAGSAGLIVTNPPIRAGKDVIYGLFQKAYDWLMPGGRLYVVIQKKQGADSAVKELTRLFGSCETVDRTSGYHVLRAVR